MVLSLQVRGKGESDTVFDSLPLQALLGLSGPTFSSVWSFMSGQFFPRSFTLPRARSVFVARMQNCTVSFFFFFCSSHKQNDSTTSLLNSSLSPATKGQRWRGGLDLFTWTSIGPIRVGGAKGMSP